ncbi:hypothetical protein PCASD_19915 [Puccinia coronata f. sp. avenae]|uniref:Uncharacterized protein n=1 Tax=Puccinia coronata f. sp. avenae TaxID=200324 RepID=A0A2N5U802_9BASI|nr:hypothetical protein PCASD_19915 [Puccinia coronata f. sp. avenae]
MANWKNTPNNQGMIGIYADDSWFPSITSWQDGQNLTYPYFFIIITAGAVITGGKQHQATIRPTRGFPLQPTLILRNWNPQLQPPAWIKQQYMSQSSLAPLPFSSSWFQLILPSPMRASDTKSGFGRPPYWEGRGGGGGGHHHQHILARTLHLPTSSLLATHGPKTTFAPPAEHQHHQHRGAGSEAALATPNGHITLVNATMVAHGFCKALRKPNFELPEAVPRPSSTSSAGAGAYQEPPCLLRQPSSPACQPAPRASPRQGKHVCPGPLPQQHRAPQQ